MESDPLIKKEDVDPGEEAADKPKEKLWTKKNAILLFSIGYANFTCGTCYSLPAPFFPHEAESKGASPTVYGLVFGVFQLVNLVMSPVWGKLMPYLIPRFVLIMGMFVGGTCSVLFGILELSPPGLPFIVLSFCVRIVESVGVTAYVTTCYGLIPVMFPSHRATVLSIMETLLGVGLIVGPTVGGALYQVGGYKLPFIVMGGCLIFGSFLTALTFSGEEDQSEQKTGSFFAMFFSKSLIMVMLVSCSASLCIGYNDATLEPHLRQFGLSPVAIGSIFIIPGGIYAVAAPFYGILIDKGVKPIYLCLLGCVLSFFCYLLIGPVPFLPVKPSLTLVIVALVFLGFSLGAKFLSAFMHGMNDVLKRGFPDNVSTYALFTGVIMVVSSFGTFVGPSMGGFFLDHIGYENGTIVILGIDALLTVVLIVTVIRNSLRKDPISPPVISNGGSEINAAPNEEASLLKSGV